MKEPNEIDQLFLDGLNGLAFIPDTYVKENIDRAIASKKKRRRFLFILFPVLLGVTGFAAIGLVDKNQVENGNQNKNKYQSQNETRRRSVATDLYGASSDHLSLNNPRYQTKTETKNRITRNNFQTTNSSGLENSSYLQKSETVFSPDEKLTPSQKENSEAGFEGYKQEIRTENTVVVNSIDSIQANRETLVIAEKPDTSVVPVPDSASTAVSEALKHLGSNKGAGKWSLSVVTYWEGESKKHDVFNNEPFEGLKKETAQIRSSSFYGKLEIDRQLTSRLGILTGIGFRSSRVIQYSHLGQIILPGTDISSGSPQPGNSLVPDTLQWKETQTFLVNSILVPIGLTYTFPLGNKLHIRISGGGEFAYGQLSSRFTNPDLSAPKFNAFGCSLWLRPEMHVSLGRTQLFGFATFNQLLAQQLKWNIQAPRNPAFGAGIGWRIRL